MNKKTLTKAFNKLVLTHPDNFIIIFFKAGTGGSSLLRILISHDELYHSFKYLGQPDYDDPIRYPDSIEGFYAQAHHGLSFKEQHLACAHVDFHTPWNVINDDDTMSYFKLVNQGKTVVLKTHDFNLYQKFKNNRCIFIVEDNPLDRGSISSKVGNYHSIPEKVFVVNINNLMSKNYDTFLNEYIKLVQEFNLTPRINSVRSFILMWLERQERFKRTLS